MNAQAPNLPQFSPLKIALLGYRSHPHVGGQGIYLQRLSRALVELGHSVDVISGPPYPELDSNVRLIKLPSLNLYEHPSHITALRPKHLASRADVSEWLSMATGGFGEPYSFGRRAAKHLKKYGKHYDVIHDNQCLSSPLLTLQKQGWPLVTTIHHPITQDRQLAIDNAKNWQHRLGAKRWYHFTKMQTRVARQLKHVVTVSHASKADIQTAFGTAEDALQVIPNGVDVSVFKPLAEVTPKPFRVVTTTSSDQPLKGLSVLLQAIALLKPALPAIDLVIIGKLNPEGPNSQLIKKLGLSGCVSFKHGISELALNQEYAKARIAVTPSLYEGFGLPAVEAMASGTPLVSSDGGALKEVVGNAGLVVPAGNANALANAMQTLLLDKTLQMKYAQKGRTRVLECFCWRRCAEQLSHLYQSIVNQK